MSRVGRSPIVVSDKVQVTVSPQNVVTVKGPKSSQSVAMRPEITVKIESGKEGAKQGVRVLLTRNSDAQTSRSLHGLYRALLQNAVTGVTTGFTKTLELVGVGYRASVSGKKLELALGFSHPIIYQIPDGIEIKVEKQTTVTISGASKELVGQVAAKVRSLRPPEPYLGKGVKYADERIRRKAGKSAGK